MKSLHPIVDCLGPTQAGMKARAVQGAQLSEEEFELFRQLFVRCCGIKLGDTKRLLVQNRVGKRLRALGLTSFSAYYRYVSTPEGRQQELHNLLNAITTNQTYFFREPHHFDILQESILPELSSGAERKQPLRVWSAGCSTGQEPYTLAMVLDNWLSSLGRSHGYRILATDIDSEVLAIAEAGRYPLGAQKEFPPSYVERYMEVSGAELVVKASLRNLVTFRRQNLAELQPARPRVDIIFCRNVIMYLHPETRAHIEAMFCESLVDGGYVVVGSSESLRENPGLYEARRYGRTLTYRRSPASAVGGMLPAKKSKSSTVG